MLQNLASLANVTNLIQFCDCFNLAKNKNLNYHVCFNICFLLFKAYFLCRVFWGIGEGWVNLFLIAGDQFVQWIKRRSRKVFTNRDPIQSKKNAHCHCRQPYLCIFLEQVFSPGNQYNFQVFLLRFC